MAETVTSSIPEYDSNTPKRKRGPYNRSKYIANAKQPRSTLWYNRQNHSSNIEQKDIESDTSIETDNVGDMFNIGSGKHYPIFADDEKDADSDENSDEDAEDQPDLKKEEPLYQESRINLLESMMLLITFVMRHQLSREATKDLLKLVELHCPLPNLCRSSLHHFYSYSDRMSSPVQRHHYCQFCKHYSGLESNQECLICGKRKERNFMYIPLAGQLQSILSGFSKNDLQCHMQRENNENVIGDVYDGNLYKKLFNGCHFVGTEELAKTKECHISLQLNTDGVSIFRSSSYSVWPLYLIINELNPKQRFKSVNRLFAGLWFGEIKPLMNVFLAPLIRELSLIYDKGTSIILQGKETLLRAVLLNIVCDAPARCLMQNFVQFNGFFGCGCCLAKGLSVKTSARGSMLSYPYDTSEPNASSGHSSIRKHCETIEHARDAEVENKANFGVKGYTILSNLLYFDIIRGVTIDYMHCVLLGVQKMLLHVWTDPSQKTEKYYIGDFSAVLDDRLRALTTPNVINRSPRGITDLKHWKASEYRSFLLFHSVCCLQGILPEEYFIHYMLFVEGIYLLLQSTILKADISKAKLLLAKFCSQIDYMYAPRYETFNVHSLLHLAEKVDESGPLWCQSCFFFEDLNGDLRSLFHGTTKIELQIASAVVIHQQLPELISLSKGSEVDILYQRLTNSCKFKNREFISGHILAVGKQVECQLLLETRQVIEHKLGPVENIAKFYRLLSGGVMFQSKMYLSVTKRNSYTVEYLDGSIKFGQILYFLKVDTHTKCTKYLAVIKQFQIVECTTKLPYHFQEVKELTKTDIVEVQYIREMCYFAGLTSSQKYFIGKIPVFSESD